MTELDIGKAVKEILSRDNTAVVKHNKERNITVYEIKKNVVKTDKER